MSNYCTHTGQKTLHYDCFGQANERCSDCGELWILERAEEVEEPSHVASLAVLITRLERRITALEILPHPPCPPKQSRKK